MIAVLFSGQGRSLANLIDNKIPISFVATDKKHCGGMKIAEDHKIPIYSSKHLFSLCESFSVKLVVLAGYLSKVEVPDDWIGKIINIHPSLLPSFGGPGMYGMNVHRAAIDRGVKYSGCTVHYVTNEYDAGPIILQQTVPVSEQDTPETLANKVFDAEKIALPMAINMHLSGSLKLERNKVRWDEKWKT